ncbi:ABC transporter ATP-binding protein [Rhizobium leguminosarum]|uniref:ABC transporter ATP-binding protein n=2 Tax=Rhizobium TaxID=379 RepID=UPI001A91964A|nr:ATP-binding cassette domain-containing protein [Rhizobium leguminosarum]MBY3157751.1 ABC transporter ATP-binding protein [Rhizobium laguerreae]MBY5558330.1 ABC transporter ATP-binding protein [Rhizobium leguminosarum]MBY5666191.1 ABC transporter ATP-binding protein [Rhizobium leguminosarum]MBY5679489.1 ABC transporter ATP-binding protein [Rhizobium leguminosarum]MBY5727982.1 ABC transporter ATP-binding protein [Rhizobium leguminosarum]
MRLEVDNLGVSLRSDHMLGRARTVHAVKGVSFSIDRGEAVGLVGESGSGKTTIARAIMGVVPASTGEIRFRQEGHAPGQPKTSRAKLAQMIFQDAAASLNPRLKVRSALNQVIAVHHPKLSVREREAMGLRLLRRVALDENISDRFPRELSGGQAQRVAIARALIPEPSLLVCDEPVSALDVSVQAGILRLLDDLRRNSGTALLMISHDLAAVRALCDRIIVLKEGEIVEAGPAGSICSSPTHAYTKALVDAVAQI